MLISEDCTGLFLFQLLRLGLKSITWISKDVVFGYYDYIILSTILNMLIPCCYKWSSDANNIDT